jgi:HNH endonuclease
MSGAMSSRERKAAWQRASRAKFKAAHGYSETAHYATGGNRESVLTRDGFACVRCGMTDEAHKAKWNRPITIDHISKDRRDNSMGNLQTLCLECHGEKDLIATLREPKAAHLYPDMVRMRAGGATYQTIADELGISIATAWLYLTGARI